MSFSRSWIKALRMLVGALICYALAVVTVGGTLPKLFWPLVAVGGLLELGFWKELLFGSPQGMNLDPDEARVLRNTLGGKTLTKD